VSASPVVVTCTFRRTYLQVACPVVHLCRIESRVHQGWNLCVSSSPFLTKLIHQYGTKVCAVSKVGINSSRTLLCPQVL
jgi:hypothetical protein